jgi:hypothetical protein
VFYESGSNAVADVVRLEPSASKTFWITKWDFNAIPLKPKGDESPNRKYCVVVHSTKGEILRSPSPIELSSVEITGTIKHK